MTMLEMLFHIVIIIPLFLLVQVTQDRNMRSEILLYTVLNVKNIFINNGEKHHYNTCMG